MSQPMMHQLVTGVVYSQSGVYDGLNPADIDGMTNGTADGSQNSNETGINRAWSDPPAYVQADCGSSIMVHHVVVGYDYLSNLGSSLGQVWGPGTLSGATLSGSDDGATWTPIATIPDYDSSGSSDGLLALPVDTDYQYLQVSSDTLEFMALLEFEIWTLGTAPPAAPGVSTSDVLATPCTIQDLRNYIGAWDALCAGVESEAAIITSDAGLSIAYPYSITTDASVLYNQQQRSYTLTTPCSVRRLRVGLQRWDAACPGAETQAILTTDNITLTVTFPPD